MHLTRYRQPPVDRHEPKPTSHADNKELPPVSAMEYPRITSSQGEQLSLVIFCCLYADRKQSLLTFGRRPVALRFGDGRQRPPTTLDEVMTSVSWLWINVTSFYFLAVVVLPPNDLRNSDCCGWRRYFLDPCCQPDFQTKHVRCKSSLTAETHSRNVGCLSQGGSISDVLLDYVVRISSLRGRVAGASWLF